MDKLAWHVRTVRTYYLELKGRFKIHWININGTGIIYINGSNLVHPVDSFVCFDKMTKFAPLS